MDIVKNVNKSNDSAKSNNDHKTHHDNRSRNTDNIVGWYAVCAMNVIQNNKLAMMFSKYQKPSDDNTSNTNTNSADHVNYVYEVYVPKEIKVERKNDKFITKESIPVNSIFVKTTMQFLSGIIYRSNIKFYILGPVKDNEIKKLKDKFNIDQSAINELHSKKQFEVGMMVRVTGEHDCKSLDGEIIEIYPEDEMVKLRIWIIKGCEPIEISIKMSNIKPINGERYEDE